MEESAQRKERLKAMRMEASQAATYNVTEHSTVSYCLSNPLIESSADNQGQADQFVQRFGYYTDPMSGFTGNKQRSKVGPQIQQGYSTPSRMRNPEMNPLPAPRAQINHPLDQRMHQAQGHYTNIRGMGSPSPGPSDGGTSNHMFPSNAPRGGYFSSPGIVQGNSPGFDSRGERWHWYNTSPRPDSRPGQEASPSFNSGRGRGPWLCNSPGRGSGQGRGQWSNSGPGRGSAHSGGQLFSNSPGHGSGQGRGQRPGQIGGRAGSSHNHVSAKDRPDIYYNKSMVEDPWKFLEPKIWQGVDARSLNTPSSVHDRSWLPKSISNKKTKVSEAPKQTSNFNLAEILAASFNEAVNEEPTV